MFLADPSLAELVTQSHAADHAWHAELVATFGLDACNARYDGRGCATPELERLHGLRAIASDAERAAWQALWNGERA